MKVEVALAEAHAQRVIEIDLPAHATVADALHAAGRAGLLPAGGVAPDGAVGIFGEVVATTRELCDGDRLEIYRPLQADPKHARQRRAGENKTRRSK